MKVTNTQAYSTMEQINAIENLFYATLLTLAEAVLVVMCDLQ